MENIEFHTYIYILMLNSMMKKESQAWIQNGNPAEQTIQKQMGEKKKFVGHDEVRGYFDAICVNSEVPIRGHLKLVMKKVFDLLLPHLAPFYREMPWRVTVPILLEQQLFVPIVWTLCLPPQSIVLSGTKQECILYQSLVAVR